MRKIRWGSFAHLDANPEDSRASDEIGHGRNRPRFGSFLSILDPQPYSCATGCCKTVSIALSRTGSSLAAPAAAVAVAIAGPTSPLPTAGPRKATVWALSRGADSSPLATDVARRASISG